MESTTRISFLTLFFIFLPGAGFAGEIRGKIVDAASNRLMPARLYIESESGRNYLATTAARDGIAVPYSKKRGLSEEVHTTLSAHPFMAELPAGKYTLTAEHGKEYHSERVKVEVAGGGTNVTLKLRRWTNMAEKGWFSGETHVHRTVKELPALLLAEDLNVALPLTAWVTDSRDAPSEANKNPDPVPPAKLIKVDGSHVIWPVNTEYEIFTVNGKRHTLGAVFVLNHREPLTMTAPPVKPIAAEARRQDALLDLDKHNWPWSMMIVQQMGVGLFELTNNHLWRTRFMFTNWYPEYVGDYMQVERQGEGFTEGGWIDFGFQTYYALLNCGFDIKPTAGTASGVHPVPLGFGRVYVKIDDGFTYEKWIEGLAAGRSFVTTGPMLMVDASRDGDTAKLGCVIESASPIGRIEIIRNGEVVASIASQPELTKEGAYRFRFEHEVPLTGSSWVAVRTFEARPDKRPRFAHSAPVHFEVEGKPLRPRLAEVEYLIQRVGDEIARHQDVLDEESLAEYQSALAHYQSLLTTAR